MSCSICGEEGHNARTCPLRNRDVPRDYALWMKFDNITQKEAADLQAQIIKDTARIAPQARGTGVKGPVRELPERIRDALQLPGEDELDKKKKRRP